MKAFLLGGVAVAMLSGGVLPASAQTRDTEIVMRRPIPSQNGSDVPSTIPTPTPTPGVPGTGTGTTPAPTPTPTPTGPDPYSQDPDKVVSGGDPNSKDVYFQWVTGEWSGGGQCGKASTMTRQVSCVAYPFDWNAMPQTVAASYCETPDSGPMPPTTYAGDGANCGYTVVTQDRDTTPWILPDWATGTATCSANAYRQLPYSCVRDTDGATVDKRFCEEQIADGKNRNYDLPPFEYGNYSGCTSEWKARRRDMGCHPQNDPYGTDGGDVHFVYQDISCVRSDGTELTGAAADAACGPTDRPHEGLTSWGSCHPEVSNVGGRYRCLADGQTVIDRKIIQLGNRDVPGMDAKEIATSCYAAGATCVASRSPAQNYSPVPPGYSAIEIICTGGQPVQQGGGSAYYPDECDKASDPALGCPLFYNNGGYDRVWIPDQQVPTDPVYNPGGGGGGIPIGGGGGGEIIPIG